LTSIAKRRLSYVVVSYAPAKMPHMAKVKKNHEKYEIALGQRIQALRKERKWSQQEAADRYGCIMRRWQQFEEGSNVTLGVLHRIAKVLSVEPWQLLK
jgi:DNA-binding Xre family transcriptional regulator